MVIQWWLDYLNDLNARLYALGFTARRETIAPFMFPTFHSGRTVIPFPHGRTQNIVSISDKSPKTLVVSRDGQEAL